MSQICNYFLVGNVYKYIYICMYFPMHIENEKCTNPLERLVILKCRKIKLSFISTYLSINDIIFYLLFFTCLGISEICRCFHLAAPFMNV